jgi:nucleoside permease NupC
MSAPAALAVSKIAYPETEESATSTNKKGAYDIPPSGEVNVIHAATNGAVVGTQLALNIAGNLIAFLALIAMLDNWLGYLGERVDIFLSFNAICEVVFFPFAWLMGVDTEDCREVAAVLGLKIFANEFVAYEELAFVYKDQISDRSFYIASYALCGFSNFGSIGIQLGGLTPLAPNQGKALAKLVFSAMIAGNTGKLNNLSLLTKEESLLTLTLDLLFVSRNNSLLHDRLHRWYFLRAKEFLNYFWALCSAVCLTGIDGDIIGNV